MPVEPHHDPKRIIEAAFSPEGPIYDGPKSKGRRTYDQTFWWIRVVKDVGFPIVAAWWIATRLIPTVEKLEKAVEHDSRVTAALICKLDPDDCTRVLAEEAKAAP